MSFVDKTQYATGGIIGNTQAIVKRAVSNKIFGLPGNEKSVYLGLGAMNLGAPSGVSVGARGTSFWGLRVR